MNQLKTILFLGILTALLVGIGGAVSPGSMKLFLILAILMNVGMLFFSDKLVLKMSGAKELGPTESPRIHQMVEELCRRADIPKPRLYVIESPQPNAFATGRSPAHAAVAVNTGLLQLLDEQEIRGVLAHEIAHIKNRDILIATIASVIAGVIGYVANVVQWGAILGSSNNNSEEDSHPASGLAMAFLAPIAATLLQLAISRSREYVADRTGAELCGTPHGLASALRKLHHYSEQMPTNVAPATASLYIVNPLAGMGSLMQLFSTHPPLEKRIAELLGR